MYFESFVKEELNVKEIKYHSGEVELDLHLTEMLLAEGFARDFVRVVQDMRKKVGLQLTDRITLMVDPKSELIRYRLNLHQADIMKKLLVVKWLDDFPCRNVKVGDIVMGIDMQKFSEPPQ